MTTEELDRILEALREYDQSMSRAHMMLSLGFEEIIKDLDKLKEKINNRNLNTEEGK